MGLSSSTGLATGSGGLDSFAAWGGFTLAAAGELARAPSALRFGNEMGFASGKSAVSARSVSGVALSRVSRAPLSGGFESVARGSLDGAGDSSSLSGARSDVGLSAICMFGSPVSLWSVSGSDDSCLDSIRSAELTRS